MEIEGTVVETELPSELVEGQIVSSGDPQTPLVSLSPRSQFPSPAIDMAVSAPKEVTLPQQEPQSETIPQRESPPPRGEEILLDVEVLESSTVDESNAPEVLKHDPDSVADNNESIPTEHMNEAGEMEGVVEEVEQSILVPRGETDVETTLKETESVRQQDEPVSSNLPDENLLDAPQVQDQIGKTQEVTMVEETVKDALEPQTNESQSLLSPTIDAPRNLFPTNESSQTLSEQDTTAFNQSRTTQASKPVTSIQSPHLVPTTIPSDNPLVTESHQPFTPSVASLLPESVKTKWHAPIPPVPSPRLSSAIVEKESVPVDTVEMSRQSMTPVFSAPIPLPSPRLQPIVVAEEPVSVNTIKTNSQSACPVHTTPIPLTPSSITPETAIPLAKEPIPPASLISPVIDAQTQITPLIFPISLPSVPKSVEQPLPPPPPPPTPPRRKRSISVVIPVPSRSQTTTPHPTVTPSTADLTPSSPSRALKFKVKFNDTPSPPLKRQRVSRSKSQSVQPLPSASSPEQREMLDCIIVRKDFENV